MAEVVLGPGAKCCGECESCSEKPAPTPPAELTFVDEGTEVHE